MSVNLATVTAESLAEQLDKEVPQVYVVIAKHEIAGVGSDSIAGIIGCDEAEVDEVKADPLYREIRQILGAMAASQQADQGLMLDSLEAIAVQKLLERIPHERDPEFLLRVAATANRMERRHKPKGGILDPTQSGRAAITLTSRMVQRITAEGHKTVAREDSLSIHDGSMTNPSFEEVSDALGYGKGGLTPHRIPMQNEALDFQDLEADLERRLK